MADLKVARLVGDDLGELLGNALLNKVLHLLIWEEYEEERRREERREGGTRAEIEIMRGERRKEGEVEGIGGLEDRGKIGIEELRGEERYRCERSWQWPWRPSSDTPSSRHGGA